MCSLFVKMDIPLITLSEKCTELTEFGELIDGEISSRMEFHFEAMLDDVVKWKKHATTDASLLGLILSFLESHQTCICSKLHLFYSDN